MFGKFLTFARCTKPGAVCHISDKFDHALNYYTYFSSLNKSFSICTVYDVYLQREKREKRKVLYQNFIEI